MKRYKETNVNGDYGGDADAAGQQLSPQGISLRDYFAAAALTGLITAAPANVPTRQIVEASYRYADLMISVREK
jgi:hypothetical protein